MLHVDQSVWSTQIVLQSKHARGTNVLTPAQEPVGSTLNVMSEVILQCVYACQDMKEILSHLVDLNPLLVSH